MSTIDLGCEDANRFIGGRRQCLTRSQAESRAVTRANDFGPFNRAAREFGAVVRADVLNGEIFLAAARHRNVAPAQCDRDPLPLADGGGGPRVDPRRRFHHIIPVCSRASSDIMLWFHGGSKTSSTLARVTVGTICTFSRTSCTRTSPMPQPGAVSVILISTVRVSSAFLLTSHTYTNPRSTMFTGISGS